MCDDFFVTDVKLFIFKTKMIVCHFCEKSLIFLSKKTPSECSTFVEITKANKQFSENSINTCKNWQNFETIVIFICDEIKYGLCSCKESLTK